MDKTFNFFKTKTKKQNLQPRINASKSNSSKASNNHNFQNHKPPLVNKLTKKQRQLRQAIEYRFQKSKQSNYKFQLLRSQTSHKTSTSNSSQKQEYSHLKDMQFVDIKQYHRQPDRLSHRNNNSLQNKRPNIRLKIKDSNSSIFKTEGSLPSEKSPYLRRLLKEVTPTKTPKKAQEWKFISIEFKQGLSKNKNLKTQVKINSHRSYNLQHQKTPKTQPSSSMNKYHQKVPKLKDLGALNLTKF